MDLTVLALFGSLLFGLIIGDATFLGNSLYVDIAIAPGTENAGPSAATAEGIFVAGIHRYTSQHTHLQSAMRTPSVDTSSASGLAVALARPLQLESVVYALQAAVRDYGVVKVTGTLMSSGQAPGLKMFAVIQNPPDPPVAISLVQPDGNAKALIEQAARETMVAIGPYRVAVTDFEDGLAGDAGGFDRSRETVERGLAQPWDSRSEGATETALLINLQGLLALRVGKMVEAGRDFSRSKAVRGANDLAYAFVSLNQAFLAIATRQTAEASLHYKEGASRLLSLGNPNIVSRVKVMAGLLAWSVGDAKSAEREFRAAIDAGDNDEMPHVYLAELLAGRDDTAGAEAERTAGTDVRRFDPKYPILASTVFRVDPVHGGVVPMF